MFKIKYTFPLVVLAMITFTVITVNISLNAQELPVEDLKPGNVMIDTIDQTENLLDSNEVYKKQFDSLSKEGEWVEMDKSEFLQELTEGTGEILDFDDNSGTTEIIYVWRPYVVDNTWNPYYNGSWVFTNFGWVWNSYYSWGWAPYNYGRWYSSSYYGWVWFPGNYWAPNYVSWRSCGNYVGWYPTCPRFRWRGRGTQVYTNHLYAYNPQNWVFVDQKDFSKKITKNVIVKSEENRNLLTKSQKINIATYTDPSMAKFKYNGPDAVSLAKESGTRITPQIITAGNSEVKTSGTKFDKTSSTKSENANVKTNGSDDIKNNSTKNNTNNTKTSNSKEKKQPDNTKKYENKDVNSESYTKEKSVTKPPEKKSGKKSNNVNSKSNMDSVNEKNIKSSDSRKNNSNSNSSKSRKSSNNFNSKKNR